MLCYKNKKKGS